MKGSNKNLDHTIKPDKERQSDEYKKLIMNLKHQKQLQKQKSATGIKNRV